MAFTLPDYYPGPRPITPFLGLGLWGMDEAVAIDFIKIDQWASALTPGSTVEINSIPVSNPNFEDSATVTFSVAGSVIKLTAVGSGVSSVFGRTGVVTAQSGDYSAFYDALGAAATAQSNAESYANGLASNYDPAGAAATAQSNAEAYASGLVSALVFPVTTSRTTHRFFSSYSALTGVFGQSQPTVADLSDTPSAHQVLAGPTSGPAATATFRALVASDIPALPYGSGAWATLTGDLTETQVIPFDGGTPGTPDSGISRIGAASLAIGNGSAGDFTGSMQFKTLTLSDTAANTDLLIENTTAATFTGNVTGLVASGIGSHPGTSDSVTLNTSLATLLVFVVNYYGNGAPSVSDNKGNVWHKIADTAQSSGNNCAVYYSYTGNVGTSHSFSTSGNVTYDSFWVYAFSGTLTTSAVFDAASTYGPQNLSTPVTLGPLIVTTGDIVVAAITSNTSPSAGATISGTGFTTPTTIRNGVTWSGAFESGAASYNLGSGSSVNPTFTATGFSGGSGVMVAFKAAPSVTMPQESPIVSLSGTYWNGSASATDAWSIQATEQAIPNGQSKLSLTHSGSSGLAAVEVPNLSVLGEVLDNSGWAGSTGASLQSTATGVKWVPSGGLTTSGLIAEYRFLEGSGTTVNDYSPNSNNAAFGGTSPIWNVSYGDTRGGIAITANGQTVLLPNACTPARTIYMMLEFNSTGAYQTPLGTVGPATSACSVMLPDLGSTPPPNVGGNRADTDSPMGYSYANNGVCGSNIAMYHAGTGWVTRSYSGVRGRFLLTICLGSSSDSTFDRFFINGIEVQYEGQGQSAGLNIAQYQLGGCAAGGLAASYNTWFGTGAKNKIFHTAFYSNYHTTDVVSQNCIAILAQMAARGCFPDTTNNTSPAVNLMQLGVNNVVLCSGDSITAGSNTTVQYPSFLTGLNNIASCSVVGIGWPSQTIAERVTMGKTVDDTWYNELAASNVVVIWEGTNDLAGSSVPAIAPYCNLSTYVRERQERGWMVMPVTMISRTQHAGDDAEKNKLNLLIRQGLSDVIDMAASFNLGADGAANNTIYFGDTIHPTAYSHQYIVAPMVQQLVNRILGNHNLSSAATYTSSVTLADADAVAIMGSSSGSQVITLESAIGYTGQNIVLYNSDSHPWTVVPKPIVSGVISATSLTSTTLTVTVANNFVAGDVVVFRGLNTNTTKNGFTGTIATASSSQFTMTVTASSWSGSDSSGVATLAAYAQLGAITNVVETSGSVVTLTVNNNYAAGQSLTLSGLTTATWLNGQSVTIIATGLSSTQIEFNDPTSHGSQGSHAEVGYAQLTYPQDTINNQSSIVVASGATCILQSVLIGASSGGANWVTLQNGG